MCTAHPYNHLCGHNSVQWNFCPRSTINFANGLTTPCVNQHSARPLDNEDACPILLCRWQDKGGVWTCCQCGHRPNRLGWCVFERPRLEQNALTGAWETVRCCNHTCCDYCTAYVDPAKKGDKEGPSHAGSSSKWRRGDNGGGGGGGGGGGSSATASSSKSKKHKSKR